MFRYVALIWDVTNACQLNAADALAQRIRYSQSAWSESLYCPGLRIFCADLDHRTFAPQLLSGRSPGVVLGALYRTNASSEDDGPARKVTLDELTSRSIVESRGRWLVNECWGNYVAIFQEERHGATRVLKDPTGSLPAFSTRFEGVVIVFSALADCLDFGLRSFTPNRRFLELRTCAGEITQEADALNEVTQIRRGECVEFDPRLPRSIVSRAFLWTPLRFERSNEHLGDGEQAARALRATLRSCARTWARCHPNALLRLSGGLDSSIVLACLKDAPGQAHLVSCTHFMERGASDPRPWARIAAQHAQCEHTEFSLAAEDVDLQALLAIPPAAEPYSTLMRLTVGPFESRLASQFKATAIFTGDGGDSAFGSFCIDEVVHANLRRCGPGRAAIRLAIQSAPLLEETTWATLGRSVRTWLTQDPLRTLQGQNYDATRLVHEDVLRIGESAGSIHPWLATLKRVPSEPISKCGVLLGTPDMYASASRPSARAPQIVSPIYSQPMMELALRIPADLLFLGGRSRGLARYAFADEVPRPILERTSKDRPGTFHHGLIHRNLRWLREMLLDGVLVKERLLNRAAVEEALADRSLKSQIYPGEILRHLDTEVWLRHWSDGTSPEIA